MLNQNGGSSLASPSPANQHDRERLSCLTVSDWVTFLSGERDVAFNTILNFGAILLVFVALIFSTRIIGLWQQILDGIIAVAFVTYAFYKVIRPFGRKGKVAAELLNKIMSGELKSEEDVQKKWLVHFGKLKGDRVDK